MLESKVDKAFKAKTTAVPHKAGGPVVSPFPVGTSSKPPVEKEPRRIGERRKGPFIKYVGPAARRVIRPHHWKMKVDDRVKDAEATHEWSVKNDKLVPMSEFSADQLDYLLNEDFQIGGGHAFLKVDYKDGKLVQVK